MLGKLLKYDMKALNRSMLPLQGGVLVAGVLGCFLVNFSYRSLSRGFTSSYYSSYSSSMVALEEILNTAAILLGILFFSIVLASSWVTLFLIGRHFYKNFLKEEGYLTFTLPVTTNQNVLSKIISGIMWLLINTVILLFIFVLLTLIGFSDTELVNTWVIEAYGTVFSELNNTLGVVFIIEAIVLILLVLICNVLQVYTSLVIGASIARTYKVFTGIGIYVVFCIIIQTILSVTAFGVGISIDAFDYSSYVTYSWFYAVQTVLVPLLVLYVIFAVGYFFISKYLLNTKLNLD